MLVFPRVKLRDHMMKSAPPDLIGVANPSGWMSATCFTEFIKHFIKHTKCSKDRPVILILDKHDSHISTETIDLSKENGVTLLTLPPHCSHKLQPLDRSVYDPFKTCYNQAANAFMVSHPGKTITIYDVAKLVGKADEQALIPRTIRSGFAASGITGIWPFNRDVFGEDEFLCSYVLDRPHCTTNDCNTTTKTEDVLIHSSASSTGIGIENASEFLSISAANITRRFSEDRNANDYNTKELQTSDFVLCKFSTEKR